MIDQHSKFVSSIESRLQENGELYGRFHLGTFVEGQALTVANALRRTLLSEIPGFVVTNVQIEGANHEFATLPGIHESVLNILLNIKRMAITARCSELNQLLSLSSSFAKENVSSEFQASISLSGPSSVTAGTIKFPSLLAPVSPNHHIATLSSTAELKMRLNIALLDPLQVKKLQFNPGKISPIGLVLDTIPKPVRQVNYSIFEASTGQTEEYISLEVWTDGSIQPKEALTYALEKLTRIFYEFTNLQKSNVN
jgi:DNA-directed RNA polymerase subunit alpha